VKQEAKKAAKEASRRPKPPAGAKIAASIPFERTPASHHEEEDHVHNPFREEPERPCGTLEPFTEALGEATACFGGERFDEWTRCLSHRLMENMSWKQCMMILLVPHYHGGKFNA